MNPGCKVIVMMDCFGVICHLNVCQLKFGKSNFLCSSTISILVLYRSGHILCIHRLQLLSIHFSKPSLHHNKGISSLIDLNIIILYSFLAFGFSWYNGKQLYLFSNDQSPLKITIEILSPFTPVPRIYFSNNLELKQ
jgi:hypothetical protein